MTEYFTNIMIFFHDYFLSRYLLYIDNRCHGNFQSGSKVATLNFLMRTSTVTVTFRVMDADTLAICIVEVDAKHTPSIQYVLLYSVFYFILVSSLHSQL